MINFEKKIEFKEEGKPDLLGTEQLVEQPIERLDKYPKSDKQNQEGSLLRFLGRNKFFRDLAIVLSIGGCLATTRIQAEPKLSVSSEKIEKRKENSYSSFVQEIVIKIIDILDKNVNLQEAVSDLEVVEDPSIYVNNKAIAAVEPYKGTGPYKPVLKIAPWDSLDKKEKNILPSIVFHELVHIIQNYKLAKIVNNPNKVSLEEKIEAAFYLATLKEKDGSVMSNLGAELEAYYYQIQFEAANNKEGADSSSLAGFFLYRMLLDRSGFLDRNPQIRELVQYMDTQIENLTGYNLTSFIKELKYKK